jgi:hypothetical protein
MQTSSSMVRSSQHLVLHCVFIANAKKWTTRQLANWLNRSNTQEKLQLCLSLSANASRKKGKCG